MTFPVKPILLLIKTFTAQQMNARRFRILCFECPISIKHSIDEALYIEVGRQRFKEILRMIYWIYSECILYNLSDNCDSQMNPQNMVRISNEISRMDCRGELPMSWYYTTDHNKFIRTMSKSGRLRSTKDSHTGSSSEWKKEFLQQKCHNKQSLRRAN